MKKVLALIIAIIMIFAITACKGNKDSKTTESTTKTDVTTNEETKDGVTTTEEVSTTDGTENTDETGTNGTSESTTDEVSTTEPNDTSSDEESEESSEEESSEEPTDEFDFSAEGGNLAFGKPVTYSYAHTDANWGWNPTFVNDGSLNEYDTANGGYHSSYGNRNHSDWFAIELGEGTKFDTVVIVACRESHAEFDPKYTPGMPNAFRIEISDDGENWSVVYERYCYDIPEYGPQVFQFAEVTATYVRFYGLSMNQGYNWAMKIAEFAVYNKGYVPETVKTPENIAIGATVESNSTHNSGGGEWHLNYINDGDRYNMNTSQYDHGQFTGYHTSPSTPKGSDVYIKFDFGTAKAFNKFVIFPSTEKYSTKQENKDKFYFPKQFKIEVSNDGENWTTVYAEDDFTLSEYVPVEVEFDTQNARYVRFVMENIQDYIKLSEIEIYNITE